MGMKHSQLSSYLYLNSYFLWVHSKIPKLLSSSNSPILISSMKASTEFVDKLDTTSKQQLFWINIGLILINRSHLLYLNQKVAKSSKKQSP